MATYRPTTAVWPTEGSPLAPRKATFLTRLHRLYVRTCAGLLGPESLFSPGEAGQEAWPGVWPAQSSTSNQVHQGKGRGHGEHGEDEGEHELLIVVGTAGEQGVESSLAVS